MDVIRGDGTLLKKIDLRPANAHQEVLQNVAVLLDLIMKSCPMFREAGLPGDLIGRPMNVAETIMIGYVYDQIEEYEPRAVISSVRFEADAFTGKLIPIIEIEGVEDSE